MVKGGEVYGVIKLGFVSGAVIELIIVKVIFGSWELGFYFSLN